MCKHDDKIGKSIFSHTVMDLERDLEIYLNGGQNVKIKICIICVLHSKEKSKDQYLSK